MRVVEHAGVTDPGKKRRRNEDSFVADPPVFAVADGMGGAQAGEVASRLAAAAFREFHEADELDAERRVEAIIQEANRRIYERARVDAGASGMGTTVTAALVEPGVVAIGHVGDSRAYRIRDGRLEQLTEDHSLVGELVRSGRLSREEAEVHPQRSVITRVLGTDPSVDVDTFAVEASSGDLFLICSDGLTSMVPDEEILRVVREADSLERAAKTLVKSANRRGGEDNVTVILFSVEADGGASLEETARLDAAATRDDRDEPDELEDTLTGLEVPTAAQPGADDTVVAPPDSGWEPVGENAGGTGRKGPRPRRRLLLAVVAIAFVAVLLLVAFWGLANAHFVGAETDGRVAVYQGLPYDVGGGVSLYRARYVSALHAAQLTEAERRALFDHDLMAYDAARARIAPYEEEGLP